MALQSDNYMHCNIYFYHFDHFKWSRLIFNLRKIEYKSKCIEEIKRKYERNKKIG